MVLGQHGRNVVQQDLLDEFKATCVLHLDNSIKRQHLIYDTMRYI